MSTRPQIAFYQKINLPTTAIIFFINNKTRCTYFNSWMLGGSKRSNILKQTYNQKLVFILSTYDLLLTPGMRVLKGGTVKERRFCEFLISAMFKEILIQTNVGLLL